MKVKLSLAAGAGLLAGAGALWLALRDAPGRPTEPGAPLTLLVGASLLGCGLASWRAQPANRLGRIMMFTGFAWFATQLIESSIPWVNTIGLAVQAVWIVGLVYLLLSFPTGRLTGRLDRTLVRAGVFTALGLQLAAMLYGDKAGLDCPGCTANLIQVAHDNQKAQGWLGLQRLVGIALIVTIIALLSWRWLRASTVQRRAVAPVVAAGGATLTALTATIVFDLVGAPLGSLPADAYFTLMATVPVAVLFVFLQRRLARGVVASLVVQLGGPDTPTDLRHALARALGDPSLQLAFWFPAEKRYVDSDGIPIALPTEQGQRISTFVERRGQPIAVLVHDPALEHNAELVTSVCAAASLTLENERLQAELRARLVELQASRARLVQATDTERRRIERDLHDGTQQRLVSVAMSLGILDAKLPAQAHEAKLIVRETRQAIASALAELRELTRGINPPLLAERGLGAALEELCRRAALPAHLHQTLEQRFPDHVETAVYFTASEALTNAAKHSHANDVRLTASYQQQTLIVEVSDDGIGGAATMGGTGLRGLADRIEALGGRLTVSSPPGRGTTLRAEIPCA